MLEEILVQGVRNLQPADERESIDIFTAIRDLGELALEQADVRLEAVTLPHLKGEEVMVVLLDLRQEAFRV